MTKNQTFDFDLIVIGSGASGSVAATKARQMGKKVAIVEAGTFGGQSPNHADIPLSAMLHAANIYDQAKNGANFGIRSTTLGYSFPGLKAWKDLAIKRTGTSNNRRFYESQGIATIAGQAHFLAPNEISVNRRHYSASKFVIATGSSWKQPDIQGIDNVNYYTPSTIIDCLRPPKNLLVVGAGESGIEVAHLMASFGSKVYLVEKAKQILPSYDLEVSDLMNRYLTNRKGVSILVNTTVVSVVKDGLRKRVIIRRGSEEKSILIDDILIATGRVANTDLGLENAGVKYDKDGITVNEMLQTSNHNIFAAGDVLNHHHHTHTALLEGQIVTNNIFKVNKLSLNYLTCPNVIFTYPNVASVGLSETDCKTKRIAYKKTVIPLNIVARSNTANFHMGFVKLIVDHKKTVIGGSIIAPHAAEMIHLISLAVYQKMPAKTLASLPYAFLSWSEAIRVAASQLA